MKSGTHALVRTVQLIGATTDHQHYEYKDRHRAKDRHIIIFRNPRNTLISYVRQNLGRKAQAHDLKRAIYNFGSHTIKAEYDAYIQYWRDPGDCLAIRFEDLLSSICTTKRIADYLNRPLDNDVFPNIIGLTRTYTGELSDWAKHWTPTINEHWQQLGMGEIESELGY